MADVTSEKDFDLPLVSNINDILVKHYMFDFSCSFEERCFICIAVLFLEPVMPSKEPYNCVCKQYDINTTNFTNSSAANLDIKKKCPFEDLFMLIFDCHKIVVDDVEEISMNCSEQNTLKYKRFNPLLFPTRRKLKFITDKWSLKVWTDNKTCKLCFPKFIRISYKTMPEGPSLLWVTDQDKKPAVFTHGAWVNNRSLFPCQEPPSAMATWEATVSVSSPAVVLMSGDEVAHIKSEHGRIYYYYFTKSVLPLSTLCLAIGFWQEHQIVSRYEMGPNCRIFASPSLIDKSVQELFEYAPYCLQVSQDFFGPYPFPRMDFLIVPSAFGSLGMASPNIVFLSQSLLNGDSSMCSRIAHEIAHGWFGLLIGASDWTEEWLSEGFATFVEDYFHARTVNMSDKDAQDYIEIKTYIRLRTLLQEISNTDEDLQVLRSSKGETAMETIDGIDAAILKNGQNPAKAFTQVHYIKGYFLLKHLSNIVGIQDFMYFLREYIGKYWGKLVTSKDFLTEFYRFFSSVQFDISMEEVYDKWLHNPGIPDELKDIKPAPTNEMYTKILREVQKWCKRNSAYLKQKSKRKKFDFEDIDLLTSEQQILLLESMLDEPALSQRTLKDLNDFYNFSTANAEVQHRWFELVVKYQYKEKYEELKKFLTDHLAMGVYLFGEMIFSGESSLRLMAEECFATMKNEMEPNYVSTIEEMLQNLEQCIN